VRGEFIASGLCYYSKIAKEKTLIWHRVLKTESPRLVAPLFQILVKALWKMASEWKLCEERLYHNTGNPRAGFLQYVSRACPPLT
jgi:hypothetical protein